MPRPVDVTTPNDRAIQVTRVFDAPRALVFDAHTKPDLMKRWLLGPPGWAMTLCELDVREGGKYLHTWRSEETGEAFSIGGTYREIAPPERIVTMEYMAGVEGEALNTMTLTETDGKTTLVVLMEFPSQEARDSALAAGIDEGMAYSFDYLDEVLADA